MTVPLILVTNDDGIDSIGLAAAAWALEPLGELLIAAPATQQTSMGRSRILNGDLDGSLETHRVSYLGKSWEGIAVRASPAWVVAIGLQELAKRPVDLVVSGINYGENIGTCITVSGTVGAALEAADHGVRALAASLETDVSQYFDNDRSLDFHSAAYFVRRFARAMLTNALPRDVDILKLEVPAEATPDTAWRVTRLDRHRYYTPKVVGRDPVTGGLTYDNLASKGEYASEDSDAYALAQGLVSVTPLSLDMTARVDLGELGKRLGEK